MTIIDRVTGKTKLLGIKGYNWKLLHRSFYFVHLVSADVQYFSNGI